MTTFIVKNGMLDLAEIFRSADYLRAELKNRKIELDYYADAMLDKCDYSSVKEVVDFVVLRGDHYRGSPRKDNFVRRDDLYDQVDKYNFVKCGHLDAILFCLKEPLLIPINIQVEVGMNGIEIDGYTRYTYLSRGMDGKIFVRALADFLYDACDALLYEPETLWLFRRQCQKNR